MGLIKGGGRKQKRWMGKRSPKGGIAVGGDAAEGSQYGRGDLQACEASVEGLGLGCVCGEMWRRMTRKGCWVGTFLEQRLKAS